MATLPAPGTPLSPTVGAPNRPPFVRPFFEDKAAAFWKLQAAGWTGYLVLRAVSSLSTGVSLQTIVPVIIESIELLHFNGKYLCRVRSRDGAEGISVAHSTMDRLFPIFLRNVRPFFLGKDARELDLILEKVYIYDFNFRLNGLAFGLPMICDRRRKPFSGICISILQ